MSTEKFAKGDCILLNGYRYVIRNTKLENGNSFAFVQHIQYVANPNEGKWILEELLPFPPIAHINFRETQEDEKDESR